MSYQPFYINIQVFTGSGTYTPHHGMQYCLVECLGGGGGGGGAGGGALAAASGGGGGGGGYAEIFLSASQIGASQTVTIGAAGTAGASTPGAGGNGGTTSLGTLVSASGGSGGSAGTNSAALLFVNGGSGGIGTIGNILLSGGAGDLGIANYPKGYGIGGFGGAACRGGGISRSIVRSAAGQSPGQNGTQYGGGGSGGTIFNSSTATGGGPGSAGICIITEFI